MANFMEINDVLSKRKEQSDSVKGKLTPYRCVFKTKMGWSYTYHETLEDAENATHESCGYSPFGAWTSKSRKLRIEAQGPRGGWKKHGGRG